jgi:hypothetical protein
MTTVDAGNAGREAGREHGSASDTSDRNGRQAATASGDGPGHRNPNPDGPAATGAQRSTVAGGTRTATDAGAGSRDTRPAAGLPAEATRLDVTA